MSAKVFLLLPLFFSLLCAMPGVHAVREVVKRDPGACVGMACLKGCCANSGCCEGAQQQHAPEAPSPVAVRIELQLTTPNLQVFAFVFVQPPDAQDFITVDEREGDMRCLHS